MEEIINSETGNIKVFFDMDDTELTNINKNGISITLTEKEAVELANLIMNNYYGI